MGEVYVVRHVHLDRCEALKILLPDLERGPGLLVLILLDDDGEDPPHVIDVN